MDVPEEQLDVVEPDGTRVGTFGRTRVHAEGLWHEVFHCLVVRSGLPGRVLLQRRKRSACAFPSLLDLSVAGHLSAGESPLDGVREIREELGIDIDASRLVRLGRRLLVDDSGEGRNREIAHVFLLVDDTPLDALTLDSGEVDGFLELDIDELLRLVSAGGAPAEATEVDTSGTVRRVRVSSDELVPAVDGYWIVLATMADRFARGLGPIAI
ncbi:MAG: hypothetical protein JWM34_2747 [Ilumatobacteraceae bacterium]|nr:hypothetical protein [Ilumatobacteraceae bacterium]